MIAEGNALNSPLIDIHIDNLHIHLPNIDPAPILQRFDAVDVSIKALLAQGVIEMSTLQDVQAEVAAEKTVVDSAVALLNGLAAQVAALQPNQAAIDQLAADIKASTDSLSGAVTANTPGEPATPPATPPADGTI